MKLKGIRVLDMSSFLPGPYLTLAMADHGAEVIKVEAPGQGDQGREILPMDGAHSAFFRNLNRGKKSIVLNLKDPEDRVSFLKLTETADVIVESSRPGVARRLGVDYESVAARNPGIVYCSISAFGQDGPYAGRAAHDLAVEAISGVLSANLDSNARPVHPALPMADLVSGLQGLSGVLMALLAREKTGRGDFIDISMHEALVGSALNILATAQNERKPVDFSQARTTGGAAFYDIYDTADGHQIVLAGQEPKFIRNLLSHLGRDDLVTCCLSGPGPHQQPARDFLTGVFKSKTLAQTEAMLSSLDVCWGRVNDFVQALDDPQLKARGFILTDADGKRHIGPPIRFRNDPAQPDLSIPELDEHRDGIQTRTS
ncbi:CaiB/BaiF CoA transferase family protein [Hyphomonas adhaerens]|uniref:CaiB/BaiF CoA transferase family protein n=1 Tax=Hyphomonas adhaerens TaxID=81029 RepID=UPI002357F0A2|nr:CaiB/BaiF CoA-transferase family protein [Hyphomonas adhaerens]